MQKCQVYVFVTNGAKIKDGELSGTSNEVEFRYASFWFLLFSKKKSVFKRLDVL